ncbi:MAG: hypothetical protein KDA99_22520, partial [Planctomycetales bacterium]|nr:hypothetical protein [Planctomycetales bacterium]
VVVTLLGLLSSIALLSWKNAEVASQRDAAVANLRSARNAVWESFVKISDEERLQAEGLEELRLDLLKAPEPYYREFLSQTPDDPELRLEQARWRMRLGSNVYDAATRAEALTHFDRARELLESLVAQQPDVPIYRRFLAKTLGATGQIYADLDDFSRANEKYRTAIATLGQLPDMEDDGRDGEATSADDLESAAGLHVKMLALMGDNLQRIGEFDAARGVYTEAMEMQLTYRDQYVGDLALWLPKPKVADAVALLPDGEYREALELLEQALRDMEMLQISTGDRDDVQYFRAQAINQMGVLYTDSSRPHAARRCFQEAYSLAVPVADRRPGNVMFAELAADLKNNINVPLSQVHVAGETEDFVKRQQAAIVAAQRLLERNPDVTANRVSLARMRRMLAVHYLAQQAYVDARAELALAEQHMRKATESSPDVVAYAVQEIWIMLNTADVLFAQDDLPAAVEKCEWAVRQARAWLDRRNNVYFRNALIDALMRLSQYAGAVEDWPTAQQRLVARMEAIEGHPDGFRQVPMFRDLKASTLQLMAQIAFRTNDPQRGFELQEQALALRKELVVDYPDEPHLVFYLSALHETMSASLMEYGGLLSIGKAAEHALASSEAVKGIDAQYLPIDRLEGLANSESYLAQFARGGNRIDDALQHLQNASRFAHLLYDSRRESSTLVFRADCEIQIGELHAEKGQHGAAVLSFDAALALGEQVVLEHAGNEHAVNERARQLRARAYLRRGQSLENLGQYREALAAIEQAVEVGGGEDPVESRIARARLQARMGEHAKAVTQIVATLALNGIDATDQLHAADVYALAKAAAQRDLAIDEALRSQLVDDYAAKAMERLRAAEVDGALRDETAWERLRTNENLSSLRGLPAFEQFLNHPNPTKEQSFGD